MPTLVDDFLRVYYCKKKKKEVGQGTWEGHKHLLHITIVSKIFPLNKQLYKSESNLVKINQRIWYQLLKYKTHETCDLSLIIRHMKL